jgi:Fic family protein
MYSRLRVIARTPACAVEGNSAMAYDLKDDLLGDPSFRQLLTRFTRSAMAWEELLDEPLPPGMSASATWALLNDLSRDVGVAVPIPDLDGNEYWYRRTFHLSDTATAVQCASRRDSRLFRTMRATAGQHFTVKARIEETIAAARLDGLEITEADASAVLHLDKAPQTAAERLVANTFSAMDELEKLVNEPFSMELLGYLRDLLLEGVDPAELRISAPGMGLISFDYEDGRVAAGALRQLEYIIAYANDETGEEYDRPLFRALLLADVFRFYRPLGKVSSQIGRFAARLYELKHDLPVVGLLPISATKLEWEKGLITPPDVTFLPDALRSAQQHSPGDLTIYQTLSAELALLTLRRIESYVDVWERRDDEMREILKKEPLLNQRQRSILARALRVPNAEFNIRYHRRNHNVAYTTARRDLLELAEMGYLTMTQRGKAFLFTGARRLQDIAESRTAR